MTPRTVRWLTVAVVVMGVMLVGGTATLVALLARRAMHRASGPPAVAAAPIASRDMQARAATLDEPAGTRIAASSDGPDGLVLRLEGGGPDRVLLLDPRTGQVVARVSLAR